MASKAKKPANQKAEDMAEVLQLRQANDVEQMDLPEIGIVLIVQVGAEI